MSRLEKVRKFKQIQVGDERIFKIIQMRPHVFEMVLDGKLKDIEQVVAHNVGVWKEVLDSFLNMGMFYEMLDELSNDALISKDIESL